MVKLTESAHYEIYAEYEVVLLKIKRSNKIVPIGDFYGDVAKAIISPTEKYCVMAGCGVIVYQLKEPFIPYEYEKKTNQWEEYDRDGSVWIDDIVLEGDNLVIKTETREQKKISLTGIDRIKALIL